MDGDNEQSKPKSNIITSGEKPMDYNDVIRSRDAIPPIIKPPIIKPPVIDKPKDRREQIDRVSIVKFSDDALRQIGLFKSNKVSDKKKDERKDTTLASIIKILFPLIGIGGAFVGSLQEMFRGGATQGLGNIMAKVFLKIGDSIVKLLPSMGWLRGIFEKGGFVRNILAKIFGKGSFITKMFGKGGAKIGLNLFKGVSKAFVRRLPIIGSLISIGSAITRLKEGDIFGGLIDVGAAIAYMFPIPGVGTAIGIALDLFNAGMDATEGQAGKDTKLGKIGDAVVSFKAWVKEKIRDVPVLGTVIHLAEALGYLSVGEYGEFFKSLLKGAGSMIPGLGTLYNLISGGEGSGIDNLVDDTAETAKSIDWKKLGDFLRGKIETFRDAILSGLVKQLYSLLPDWMADRVVDVLGLDSYSDATVSNIRIEKNLEKMEELEKDIKTHEESIAKGDNRYGFGNVFSREEDLKRNREELDELRKQNKELIELQKKQVELQERQLEKSGQNIVSQNTNNSSSQITIHKGNPVSNMRAGSYSWLGEPSY